MKKINKIKSWERDQIAIMFASGASFRLVARKLSRSVSSIYTEIKRNSVNGEYQSIKAEELSQKRNRKSRKTNPLKNPQIYSYVYDKLRCGWSPQQIAGRLKRDNKDKTVICHETIYRYIDSPEGRIKQLSEYLVRKHRKRRPWYGRKLYTRGISNRISISQRPEEINNRSIFGHWETDAVEGKAHQSGIQLVLERKTRFYDGKLLINIDSEYGVKAQKELLIQYPKEVRQSLTLDNGKENYNHHKLINDLGISTYFCDSHCPWQKGSIENHNGILRRYIPKKTDMTTITQFELDSILEEINNRPRKCLNYETPAEAFKRELNCYQLNKGCSDSQ
jgi:IS30 family transposase